MRWWPFSKRPVAIAMPDRSTSVSDAARILASTRNEREHQKKRAWHRAYRERFGMAPDPRLNG